MIRSKLILLSLCSIALWGCKNSTTASVEETTTENVAHEHEEHTDAIELDNGKKWKVNADMLPFILNGKEIVEKYFADGSTDYSKLGSELQHQNDELTSNCTMSGKSHDELHKWLHPHLELVEKLNESKNAEEAKKIILEIKESYANFGNYFE
jgi:hypothetical protein